MSQESGVMAKPDTWLYDAVHILSCWQCLGTSHQTPGAYHLAVTYTMASK